MIATLILLRNYGSPCRLKGGGAIHIILSASPRGHDFETYTVLISLLVRIPDLTNHLDLGGIEGSKHPHG